MSGVQLARRVLAPLALSGRAGAVAREAGRISDVLEAELVLLHVGRDTAEARAAFAQHLHACGLGERQILFRPGKPERVICRAAQELGAELIVAGALESEGPLGYYIGSVARRIARQAHCSVLLLTHPRAEPDRFQRWVVDVDDDPPGLATIRFALELARIEKPDFIDVTREYDLPGFGLAMERDLDVRGAEAMREQLHGYEEMKLTEFLSSVNTGDLETAGVRIRPVCLRGREGWEAAEHARNRDADLLITPAPPHLTFWDKFFQHGVEFALESLPCALLLYRKGTTEPGA